MRERQGGMVLLTTIIMIVLLTMLVLTLMQAVFLYIKVSNQVVIKHEALYQLEAVAHRLMVANTDLDCMVSEEEPNQVVDLLLHDKGCSLIDNNRQYYYVIDDLGLYPCLQIVTEKKIYSSHLWLVTTATAPPRQDIIQLRIARPDKEITCDVFNARQINKGVISWRYLPYGSQKTQNSNELLRH